MAAKTLINTDDSTGDLRKNKNKIPPNHTNKKVTWLNNTPQTVLDDNKTSKTNNKKVTWLNNTPQNVLADRETSKTANTENNITSKTSQTAAQSSSEIHSEATKEIKATIEKQQNNSTTFNDELAEQLSDLAGTLVVSGKYVLGDKLNQSQESGEADLYFAESTENSNQKKFVAKIYRRNSTEILEKFEVIKNISSPYIAKIEECALWNNRQLIIIPYYQKGSLDDKRITDLKELSKIISQINQGLNDLHNAGIIHKDIKPANLMIQDNGDIAIIDFGISSVLAENTTVSKTRLGLTPQYAALETLMGGNFIRESDYYSFGIVLYELFTGHTPFAGGSEEENSSFQLLQHLPFPKDMPEKLVTLIKGLTYKDISNRHDLNNPNRRWTYKEVCNWLKDIDQPIPGYSAEKQNQNISDNATLPPGSYTFKHPYRIGKIACKNSLDLTDALAQNWENGKKQLFRGTLTDFCHRENLTALEKICSNAEEEFNRGSDGDKVFFAFLYKFDPNFTDLVWKSNRFRNLTELSGNYLNNLYNQNDSMGAFICELLDQKILSLYVSYVAPEDQELAEIISLIEQQYENELGVLKRLAAASARITLAYAFAPSKYFRFQDRTFHNYQEINIFFYNVRKNSRKKYEEIREQFFEGPLHTKFKIWLKTLTQKD